jgi:hypothetical protein
VLKPGGEGIFMAYNRNSWLAWLSRFLRTSVEHQDAPVFRLFTLEELDDLLNGFAERRIVPERFPQRTMLERGWKAVLYNRVLIPLLSLIPRRVMRPYGWHLMAYCRTSSVDGRG